MPTCGVSFSPGYGTAFIATSITLESCIPFVSTALAPNAAVPDFDIGLINQTIGQEDPLTVSFSSGASVVVISSPGLYSQQTTCCFIIQVPTTYANQKYVIQDPQLDYSFPLFTTLETCSDMTIQFTYTATYQQSGVAVTPTVLWLDTTTTPATPSFDALSSSESDVGVYQITLKGTINDGQYSIVVFDFYLISSESVLAIPISDIYYIDGSSNMIVYFSPFIVSKPIYTVIYYLSNQDGTAYDSSVITFVNGGGSTKITISTSDSSKIGTYLLQITGELVQNNAITDVSKFTLNVVNKCYGTTIIPAQISDQVYTIKFPAQQSSFVMAPWKESIGTCNQFAYSASLYPYGQDLPPYFQFNPNSELFTIIQQDYMAQGPSQVSVTGILPWGQSYTVNFMITVECVVSHIIQPQKSDIVDIYYMIGVEDFKQVLPEFTWQPSVCYAKFHYTISQLSGKPLPTFIDTTHSVISQKKFGDNLSIPELCIADLEDNSYIGFNYSLLVIATDPKTSVTNTYIQNLMIRALGDPNVPGSNYHTYSVTVNISIGANKIQDIGCLVEFQTAINQAFSQGVPGSTNECNFAYLSNQNADIKKISSFFIINSELNTITATDLALINHSYTFTVISKPLSTIVEFFLKISVVGELENVYGAQLLNATVLNASENTTSMTIPNLSAKVSTISNMGILEIVFSNQLKIPDTFSLPQINSTVISIRIQKHDEISSNLNFTWQATGLSGAILTLQLNFENPYKVSLFVRFHDLTDINLIE